MEIDRVAIVVSAVKMDFASCAVEFVLVVEFEPKQDAALDAETIVGQPNQQRREDSLIVAV